MPQRLQQPRLILTINLLSLHWELRVQQFPLLLQRRQPDRPDRYKRICSLPLASSRVTQAQKELLFLGLLLSLHLMLRRLFCRRSLGLSVIVLLLSACSQNILVQTLSAAIPALGDSVDTLALDPRRLYLRVSVRGRTALMVLGYRDPHPGGEIDTWYSSEGETLRLQNGRILSTAGLETDWRAVRNPPLPSWSQMSSKTSVDYRRERDEMPGYRYGITESVKLTRIDIPDDSNLVGLAPGNLQWYAEYVDGKLRHGASARFAVSPALADGNPRVVYAEQCLSPALCFSWQTWPVTQ